MAFLETIDAKQIPKLMRAVGSRKKHALLHVCESLTMNGGYWDGGSRETYIAVDLATMRTRPAPHVDPPQFGGPGTRSVTIPPGIVIVAVGTFRGKPATPTIYIRPENMAKLLPDFTASVEV